MNVPYCWLSYRHVRELARENGAGDDVTGSKVRRLRKDSALIAYKEKLIVGERCVECRFGTGKVWAENGLRILRTKEFLK